MKVHPAALEHPERGFHLHPREKREEIMGFLQAHTGLPATWRKPIPVHPGTLRGISFLRSFLLLSLFLPSEILTFC